MQDTRNLVKAGVRTLQQDDKDPERLLRVFVEDEQQESCYIVHTLAVADHGVVRGIGTKGHGQCLLAMPFLEVRVIWKGAGDIKLNLLNVSFMIRIGDR